MTFANQLGDRPILRQSGRDAHDEFGSHSGGQLLESVERWAGAAAFHPGDRRLGRAHPGCEFALGETGLGTEPEHEFAELRDPGLVVEGVAFSLAGLDEDRQQDDPAT